ncbi:MAG: carbohydrate ABC transporter permease [Candidatus Hodarchaeota archaeon]
MANNYEVKPPKITMENIMVFLLIFGIVLALWGFWQTEMLLWNRIKYTTGSLWENTQPIYLELSLEAIRSQLIANFLSYLIGNLIFIAISLMVLFKYVLMRKWEEKSKITVIALALCSGLAVIMGFWIQNSTRVIAGLPAYEEGLQSGSEWINADIGDLRSLFDFLSLGFEIIFAITLVIAIALLIIHREREEILVKEPFSFNKFLTQLLENLPFYLVLIVYLLFTLLPVFLTLFVSISSVVEVRQGIFPQNPLDSLLLNYSSVMFALSKDEPAFITAFIYSVVIGLGTGILGLAVSVSAAYGLARFRFKGNNILTFLILATQMFPGMILLIPQFVIWFNLGLLREEMVLFGVLLAYASGATAYCTWMMKGYFETIPIDIEEAAIIDGAGRFGTFTKIALPLAKPGMVAVLIFTFLTAWQEFILARTFIGETNPRATLPLLFYNFQNTAAPDVPVFYELLSPYAILVALPVVVFFLLLQKELAKGAVAGGIK